MARAREGQQHSSQVERFRRDLDQLVGRGSTLGIAVSGGPDSLALLLLAAEARPLQVEAATIDHALRPESRAEAEMVAALCERLAVPHRILTANWAETPATAIQARARAMRYRLLGEWARDRGIAVLATAHHLDDQAETFLMRLARGAGVNGLAAMRRTSRAPESPVELVRPLLAWRRSELEQVCAEARVEAVADPSNHDVRFERVRVRQALAAADWLDPQAIARSAANLAEAESALNWATDLEWARSVTVAPGGIAYLPTDAPLEIRRRIVRRSVLQLASEGAGADLRGPELDRLIEALTDGGKGTLRGVLGTGGREWRFAKAPLRKT